MFKKYLKNLIVSWEYLLPLWKKELLILFLSLGAVIVSLVNPYLAKLVIDKAYAERNLQLFILLLFLAGLLFIVNSLFDLASGYLNNYITNKINFQLNKKVFKKIQDLPFAFFQDKPSGQYLYRLNNDTSQIASFITEALPQLTFLTFKFFFTLLVAAYLNWKMTFFVLALSPFLFLQSYLFIRPIKKKTEKIWEGAENTFESVREIFSNMQLIKIFGKEAVELRRYIKQRVNMIRLQMANVKLTILSSITQGWLNKLLLALITFYGGYQIIKGSMTLGTFTAVMIYLNQLLGLEGSISNLYGRLVMSGICWDRLNSLLLAPEEIDDKEAKDFLFNKGQVQFKNVTFAYNLERNVLSKLNFRIEGGNIVGLVGLSGCGKTTIVNLILRLYSLKEGAIFIDGLNINLVKKKPLFEQIGLVLQKPLLWNDTVFNNISYGYPKASREDVVWTSQICCADNFINELPNGYNTIIGESGTNLSEGQKQRLALARAVIKNPKILIIDEGMSSLDSQTEDKIVSNLKQEFKETTIIVVSHRLSTIKKMDLVYFLEGADKITINRHEQLVKENIGYRELFASQLEEEKESISL